LLKTDVVPDTQRQTARRAISFRGRQRECSHHEYRTAPLSLYDPHRTSGRLYGAEFKNQQRFPQDSRASPDYALMSSRAPRVK
jgi:hypothetical protein